jgi:hypothetical protein
VVAAAGVAKAMVEDGRAARREIRREGEGPTPQVGVSDSAKIHRKNHAAGLATVQPLCLLGTPIRAILDI